MVSPISLKTASAAPKFAANTDSQPNASARAMLNISDQLQKQASGTLRPHLGTGCSSANSPFIALNAVIRNRPEAAAPVLRLLCREFATEKYGLAQLYLSLKTGNLNHLPQARQLTIDLDKICAVDSTPDKEIVIDALDQLISRFVQPLRLKIEQGENLNPRQLNQLVNSSVVLLKALGRISDNTVTTIGKLSTSHLEQLVALYNIALQIEQAIDDHTSIENIRNLLHRKREAILTIQDAPLELENLDKTLRGDLDVVMHAVEIMGWTLKFASESLQKNKDVVLAAVNQNGCALEFASRELKNDKAVVMSAIENNCMALQFASDDLLKDRELAIAAIKLNPISMIFLGYEFQRDPEIRALAFNRLSNRQPDQNLWG